MKKRKLTEEERIQKLVNAITIDSYAADRADDYRVDDFNADNAKLQELKREKRNLNEEQRKHIQVGLLLFASAERLTEEQNKAERRPTVNDILYVTKIIPNAHKPGAIAKYLYHELCCSPSLGNRKVAHCIELGLRLNEQGFVLQMRRALRDCKKKGQPILDAVDTAIASNIIRLPRHIAVERIASTLEELYPGRKWDALAKRVWRMWGLTPKEWSISKGRRRS